MMRFSSTWREAGHLEAEFLNQDVGRTMQYGWQRDVLYFHMLRDPDGIKVWVYKFPTLGRGCCSFAYVVNL